MIFIALFIGLPVLFMINYFFFYFYEKYLEEESVNMKEIFISKKLKEIENVNMDFKGQTVFEKLEEGVQYFVNPIRNEDENDLEAMKDLNRKREILKEKKQEVLKKKKEWINSNRQKIEEIRKLRQKIDEIQDDED